MIADFQMGRVKIPARGMVIVSDGCLGSRQAILGMNVISACWEELFVWKVGNPLFFTSQSHPTERAWKTAFVTCQQIHATVPRPGLVGNARLASRHPLTIPAQIELVVWAKVANSPGSESYCALVESGLEKGRVEVAIGCGEARKNPCQGGQPE